MLARAAAALWVAFILLSAALCTFGSPAKISVQEVSEALTCQCGCGLTVANCNHPQCSFSVPLRVQIEKMIGQGMGRAQIIAFFRAKYGEKILSAPTVQGFNLLAWIVPFAAVFAGCFLIIGAIGRWRGERRREPPVTGEDLPVYAPELREQLERELKDPLR
jgi:cytochrome c-type biogenesis protein CcmH